MIHHWFEMGVVIDHFYVFLKDCKKLFSEVCMTKLTSIVTSHLENSKTKVPVVQ